MIIFNCHKLLKKVWEYNFWNKNIHKLHEKKNQIQKPQIPRINPDQESHNKPKSIHIQLKKLPHHCKQYKKDANWKSLLQQKKWIIESATPKPILSHNEVQ